MKTFLSILMCTLALVLSTASWAAEIKLKDGSRWRGEVGASVEVRFMQQRIEVPVSGTLVKIDQHFIVVKGQVAGATKEVLIPKADIVTMKTVGAAAPAEPAAAPGAAPTGTAAQPAGTTGASTGATPSSSASSDKGVGVFVLPMSGMVGVEMRHEEIEKIAKKADEYGQGQIIVLLIESGGGLAAEMPEIDKVMREVKKRHRVVAWIREAISAAAATAIHCDEIYFMPEGVLGAMTMFGGGVAVQGEALEVWMRDAGHYMEEGGRSKYIAWAMIDEEALLSYDVDPGTGEVAWHNDLSGEFVLSDAKENLVFNATDALHSKFSDGTANTVEDLAKLMNLTKWYEVSDYGRKLYTDWQRTCKQAQEELPLLFARYNFKGAAGGELEFLGSRVKIITELIRWWERCPNVARMSLPPKEELERQLAEARKQLADRRKMNQ